jgi:hypothetical protein
MRLQAHEQLDVRGTLDVSNGTLTLKDGQIGRAKLVKEEDAALPVAMTELRVHDDLASLLPGVAAADDLGIIEGTFGTDAPTVQSSDAKATTVTQYARFRMVLGQEYIAGEDLTLRVRAGMITTVSDDTATVDVECYADDEDGGVGSDLCGTAAQSINNLTKADKDFTIDGSGLSPGDVLDFRVAISITDGSTGTAVIGEISRIALLRDIRG